MQIESLFGTFPVVASKNLMLKKVDERHLPELFSIYDNDTFFQYCGIIPKHNLQTVKKMIGHFERDYTKKSRVKWGIFQKDNPHTLVGIIETMDINQKVNAVTIGYFFAEGHWGKGIATEAVSTLVKFCLKRLISIEFKRKSCQQMRHQKKSY